MTDDLFIDLWQSQLSQNNRSGPLLPSIYEIKDPKKHYFIKHEISRLFGIRGTRKHNPAPQPVSLDKTLLPLLSQHRYAVAEKTDGVRYLLLISRWPKQLGGQPIAVMCSRKYEMYEIRIMAGEDFFQGTLLDGELVWEYENGQYAPPRQIFLVFDLVAVRGVSRANQDFLHRYATLTDVLDCGDKDIIHDPRKWIEHCQTLASDGKIVCEGNQYCLAFRAKPVNIKTEVGTVWRTRNTLRHRTDGLIFTPIDEGVCTGTHPRMFKWKSHHTIDLEWLAVWDKNKLVWDHQLSFLDGSRRCVGDVDGITIIPPPEMKQEHQLVPLVLIPNEYTLTLLQWHSQRNETFFSHIVECSCKLPTINEWLSNDVPLIECTLIKIRYDKSEANQKKTIEKTLRSVQENISIKDLVDAVTSSIVNQ